MLGRSLQDGLVKSHSRLLLRLLFRLGDVSFRYLERGSEDIVGWFYEAHRLPTKTQFR